MNELRNVTISIVRHKFKENNLKKVANKTNWEEVNLQEAQELCGDPIKIIFQLMIVTMKL